MIVNPDKFQLILIDKKKGDQTNENIVIDNKQIKSVPSVELLGIQLDNKLNFTSDISNRCKSLIRLSFVEFFFFFFFLRNTYFMAKFNYCPLVWMFPNAVTLKKITNLQKRAMRFLHKS